MYRTTIYYTYKNGPPPCYSSFVRWKGPARRAGPAII